MRAFVVSEDARAITDAAEGREVRCSWRASTSPTNSPSEFPAMYHLLNQRTDGMIAIDAEHNVHAGLT